MYLAILLSLAASFCTATSSVCQRLGARNLSERSAGEHGGRAGGFDPWLVFRLARQPAWLGGFLFMIAGFAFQVGALRFGPLALVQPILAVELLFVFGYLAVLTRNGRAAAGQRGARVHWRDWLAAAAMSAGISVFLRAAAPSGGAEHAAAVRWWVAAAITAAVVAVTVGAGITARAGVRRAAWLGIATGIAWGFVAAVIKELSSHITGGAAAIFTNWSAYVLMATGAAGMLLAAHAMAAGTLAASQPGFTIGDPVTAVLLGSLIFSERLQTTPAALAGQVGGLVILALGVAVLSHSPLICGSVDVSQADEAGAGPGSRAEPAGRGMTRR